jgi:putative colanic acid biosynthesis UDP-glucose lipid carrier transferase
MRDESADNVTSTLIGSNSNAVLDVMNANFQMHEAVHYPLYRAADLLTATSTEASTVTYSLSKRVLDIIVSGALLVLMGLAVRLESEGPALYRQRRTGLWGQPFTIYKLRTMVISDDSVHIRHASRDDPRVTRIGSFLRRCSLDELPQLLNVLKGDMSIVGPRPHAVCHDDHYSALIPTYGDRFRCKPGITGLAQISGFRGEVRQLDSMANRVALDNIYIDQWTLGLDIRILLSTLPLMIGDPQAF